MWGRKSFTKNYQIIKAKQSVGNVDITFNVQYQFYPTTATQPVNLDQNYNELYSILVNNLVRQRRASDASQDSQFFSYHAQWLIDEFASLYGVNDLYAKLALLKSIITLKTSLIIPLAKQISDTLTFLSGNKKRLTLKEQEEFDEMSLQFQNKLLKLTSDYVKFFPENKPKGALETILDILVLLKNLQSPSPLEAEDLKHVNTLIAMDVIKVC